MKVVIFTLLIFFVPVSPKSIYVEKMSMEKVLEIKRQNLAKIQNEVETKIAVLKIQNNIE